MRAIVPTALAAVCAAAIAFELRGLVQPSPAAARLAAGVVLLLAVGWLLRLIPRPVVRLGAAVAAGLAVPVLAVGRETGRWPLQEDLRGPDGYLGPLGYLQTAGEALAMVGRAWVRTVFPAAADQQHAVTAVLVLGTLLALVAVVAVIAFRAPVPAILAVAAAAAIGTLFLETRSLGAQAVLLAVLGVALLLLLGDAPRGRGPLALGAVALVVAIAGVVGLTGPLSVRGAQWGWQEWTLEAPQPVGVGFVWNQSLEPIRFRGDAVPVLRVDRRDAGYLRVEVLSRFDGIRWSVGTAFGDAAGPETFPLAEGAIAQAARVGERPVQRVIIRNLQLDTAELPLPVGAVQVDGLPASVGTVLTEGTGTVRLGQPLPIGAQYRVETVRVPQTPELLDADVLGAPTDPVSAVVGTVASAGRYADEDPVAPWSDGADQRGQKQPGPFGKEALDAARPPRSPEPAALREPDALDVSFAGMIFPGFATPGREREVQRLLDERIRLGGIGAAPLAGWREAYAKARRVTREATTPYQAAVLLEDWFQRTSTYDERATYAVNPIGALPAFVLTPKRRGHCQYFAGSMAVLLRMLGIPARVAAGFTPGTVDGAGRVITNRNAHVWVEVRFPYAGWVPFEPTPGRSLPAATSSTSPNFARSAAGVGGGALATIVGRGERPGGPNPERRGGTPAPVPQAGSGGGSGRIALGALAALALVALAGLAVWWRKRRAERAAFALDDPDAAACALRDVVRAWLADQGAAGPSAGVDELVDVVRRQFGIDAAAWADAIVRAGYAPPVAARRAVGDARRETRMVVERMRTRLDRRERLRGAVRPRARSRRVR